MPQETWDVEILNVTKQFGEAKAVDDLTLRVERGKFYSFLGPSGCGKTTTLRMIAGFEDPTSGEIRVGDKPVAGLPPFQRPVNTVFQSYALFPHMTVTQNIAFGLEMKRTSQNDIKTRVKDALKMVRLPGIENRYPKQLSGGQQQRIALARALVNRPQVLLLDEPLGALDLKLRKEMQLELKTLQREVGITFIYVTHDQEEALTMSDYIAVLRAGKLLQLGVPAEIYERPNCRFVADFIGETNFLDGTLVARDGEFATVDCGGFKVVAFDSQARSPGTQVTVAVRPEKISLQKQPSPNAPNCIPARIENAVYVGTDTRFQVRLMPNDKPIEATLQVRQQNTDSLSELHGGINAQSDWYVVWNPENGELLTS